MSLTHDYLIIEFFNIKEGNNFSFSLFSKHDSNFIFVLYSYFLDLKNNKNVSRKNTTFMFSKVFKTLFHFLSSQNMTPTSQHNPIPADLSSYFHKLSSLANLPFPVVRSFLLPLVTEGRLQSPKVITPCRMSHVPATVRASVIAPCLCGSSILLFLFQSPLTGKMLFKNSNFLLVI